MRAFVSECVEFFYKLMQQAVWFSLYGGITPGAHRKAKWKKSDHALGMCENPSARHPQIIVEADAL